ncbi:hypothetical protein [Nocardia sp. NBC_00511]|uniref:hypothetical protein n=1 Tax=Nocardia sp. NBC_00511 TaxID=2903591 RepID=UPI0030DF089D
MTSAGEATTYSRARANTFTILSVVIGLPITIFTGYISLRVVSSYTNFIYGGGDWHRLSTAALKSIPAQACLWMSWLTAGLVSMYVGSAAVVRARSILWAFAIALIVYEIGLDLTIEIATRGVDAAYER